MCGIAKILITEGNMAILIGISHCTDIKFFHQNLRYMAYSVLITCILCKNHAYIDTHRKIKSKEQWLYILYSIYPINALAHNTHSQQKKALTCTMLLHVSN